MIRYSFLLVVILGVILLLAACDSDTFLPETGGNPSSFLDHINSGCANEAETVTAGFGDAYLQGYFFVEDTLSLDIHFEANCCPGFVEVVNIVNNSITIEVGDTLYGCKCICPYNNIFNFLWDITGEVEISFQSTYWSGETPICLFDTLIVLSP